MIKAAGYSLGTFCSNVPPHQSDPDVKNIGIMSPEYEHRR